MHFTSWGSKCRQRLQEEVSGAAVWQYHQMEAGSKGSEKQMWMDAYACGGYTATHVGRGSG